jgi:DNA-binding MarR family transcriptional regulator
MAIDNTPEQKKMQSRYGELLADLLSEVMDQLLNPGVLESICSEPVTSSQFEVLLYIYRHGMKCPVTHLAKGLNISRPAATKFVDRLEEHQWVIRENDMEDNRVYYARLTERGKQIVELIRNHRLERIRIIIDRMPPELKDSFYKGIEAFIKSSLDETDLSRTICLNCGSGAVEQCEINKRWGYCLDPFNHPDRKIV